MKKTTKPAIPQTQDNTANEQRPRPQTAASSGASIFSEKMLKNIFLFSLLAMLVVTLYSGWNVGFNSDEIELNNYGKANIKYYQTFGKDTTLNGEYYRLLNSYGNGFEMIAGITNKVLHTDVGANEFNVRHLLNQIIAIAGLLYSGLVARKLAKNWLAGIFTIWLLYLTPPFMGHFLFNTRDIPFYAGYIASIYYMINFLEELPSPTWKSTIGLAVAYSFTTNVRIGGFLLLLYFGLFAAIYLFTNKELLAASLKNMGSIILKALTVVVGGTVLLILTWPYILKKPSGLIEAFTLASKFPLKVNINFEGLAIDSLHVPGYYIPKYMFVTIPIFIIICIAVGYVVYFANLKKYNAKIAWLLIISTFFPVIYAVANHAALYSGWRHFLFIYPGMCIFGGLALQKLFMPAKMTVKIGLGAVCLLLMVRPIAFCMRNNPYEYCYFNEVAGDFKSAYLSYDNDYWEISVKDGMDWVIKNEHLENTKDTVIIACNAFAFGNYYVQRQYPKSKIKVVASGVTMRNSNQWTYGVFNSLFLKPDYLENYFPPPHIHSKDIDGIPVTVILKDTVRLDWAASTALRRGQHQLADSLYTAYIKTTKDDNVGLYSYMAVAKGSLNKNDDAIRLANKCLEYHLSPLLDYNSYCALGIAYANKRQFQVSIENLRKAKIVMPKEAAAGDIMKQVMSVQAMAGPAAH